MIFYLDKSNKFFSYIFNFFPIFSNRLSLKFLNSIKYSQTWLRERWKEREFYFVNKGFPQIRVASICNIVNVALSFTQVQTRETLRYRGQNRKNVTYTGFWDVKSRNQEIFTRVEFSHFYPGLTAIFSRDSNVTEFLFFPL